MDYNRVVTTAKKALTILTTEDITVDDLYNILHEVEKNLIVCAGIPCQRHCIYVKQEGEGKAGKIALLIAEQEATAKNVKDIFQYIEKHLIVYAKKQEKEYAVSSQNIPLAEKVATILAEEKVMVYDLADVFEHTKDRLLVRARDPYTKYPFGNSYEKSPYEVDEKLAMVLVEEAVDVYNVDEIFMYIKRFLKVNIKEQVL